MPVGIAPAMPKGRFFRGAQGPKGGKSDGTNLAAGMGRSQTRRWPMAEIEKDARYKAYWDAIQQRVCGVCLDQKNDGSCGLSGRVCSIEHHLPGIVEALVAIDSPRMDEYFAAIEQQICKRCSEQDSLGQCELRDKGECALSTYLYLVTEAVQEVKEAELGRHLSPIP
jgi:hypothetical protein